MSKTIRQSGYPTLAWILLGTCLTATGCTGGSASAPLVDARSADVPPGGSGGADSMVGNNRNDGAADSGTRGNDGTVGLDATAICRRAITALVERSKQCFGYDVIYAPHLDACPDYYFSADSNRKVDEVAACIDELASRPCSDLDLNMNPSCLPGGKRSKGAGCVYPSQCESNMCMGSITGCSTCEDGNLPPGSPCRRFQCAPGDYCNEATTTCVDGSSVVYAKEGQSCGSSQGPVVVCEGDLLCRNNGVTITTLCRAVQSFDCGVRSCDAGFYCKDSSAGTCAPYAKQGESCSDTTYNSLPPCGPLGRCWNGKCALRHVAGESCNADQPCSEFLDCVNGICQHRVCPA